MPDHLEVIRRPDPSLAESWCGEGVAHDHMACGMGTLWDSSDPRDLHKAAQWAVAARPGRRLQHRDINTPIEQAVRDHLNALGVAAIHHGELTRALQDIVHDLIVRAQTEAAAQPNTSELELLRAAVGKVRTLNKPMVERLRKCAADTSPNWDGRVTVYPPETSGLVALIDALEAVAGKA